MKWLTVARKAGTIGALTLLTLELFLRLFDPLGATYFDDKRTIDATLLPDPSGYAFTANSTVTLRNWSFHIDADGTRHTPGADPNGARIAVFGDSVTFGHGVNDAEVWVSVVASRLHLNAANYGRTGYPSSGVADLMAAYGDGCAVFLTVVNDMQPKMVYAPPRPFLSLPYIVQYPQWYSYRMTHRYDDVTDWPGFYAAMEYIAARPDTLLLVLDQEAEYTALAQEYGAVVIPPYTHSVSWFDGHPDKIGSIELADSIAPVIERWLNGRDCP